MQSAIKRYLADKVYKKRGWSREQYIKRCRAAWNKAKYDPEFERKVVIDFSEPVTVVQLFGLEDIDVDFVDRALTELPVQGFEKKTGIECIVLSAGPPPDENSQMRHVKISEMFRPADSKPEAETLEQQLYFVALFDVLGFSALVAEKGTKALLGTYQDLINMTVLNTRYSGFGRIKTGKNNDGLGGFYAPVSYTYFSDTIMLWTSARFTYVSPFLTKCADLVCESLKIGMPLRGSVCFGEAVMNKTANTFIGTAIVEASAIEKNQKWIGATLGSGFMLNDVKEALSETLIVPLFCEHFKPEMNLTFPYLTLDWVSRWRARRNPDLISTLEKLRKKAPEKNKAYYDNTIDFASYVDLDDFQTRADFLRTTAYHVLDISKIKLDKMPPRPAILKVLGDIPHCGFILNLPEEILNASTELQELFEQKLLFVKGLDYPKFLESLPDTPGIGFDLAASGVVLGVEKKKCGIYRPV